MRAKIGTNRSAARRLGLLRAPERGGAHEKVRFSAASGETAAAACVRPAARARGVPAAARERLPDGRGADRRAGPAARGLPDGLAAVRAAISVGGARRGGGLCPAVRACYGGRAHRADGPAAGGDRGVSGHGAPGDAVVPACHGGRNGSCARQPAGLRRERRVAARPAVGSRSARRPVWERPSCAAGPERESGGGRCILRRC